MTASYFSVVIITFNDWVPLNNCLRSLSQQLNGPRFEVIIVDDGSTEPAPAFIHHWARYFPLTVIRMPAHAGCAAARNRGIRNSDGEIVLFVDADCKCDVNCLSELAAAISAAPEHDCFQLHLIGDCSQITGRSEELRLITLQLELLQVDQRIRYLNTAGFAFRRGRLGTESHLFDPAALRAEDTLLLANLMQAGKLPLFVPAAVVQHARPMTLMQCLRKELRTTYLERNAYDAIAKKGVKVRVSYRERLAMLQSMWTTASRPSIGHAAWFVLTIRQTIRLIITLAFQLLPQVGV